MFGVKLDKHLEVVGNIDQGLLIANPIALAGTNNGFG